MENLCPSSDMRHVLGFGVASAKCQSVPSKRSKSLAMSPSIQSPSAGSSDSGSSASRESQSPTRYKELHCLKNISMIVDADVENDFMIRQLTFNFPSCRSCSHEVLPNLLEWLKPHYRQRVSNIIEQKVHATHEVLQREEVLQVKTLSPFPGCSILFAKETKLKPLAKNSSFDREGADEVLFQVELTQLHAR